LKIYSNNRYVAVSAYGSNGYFNVNDSEEVAVDKIIDFLLDNPNLREIHFDDPDDDGNVYLHWDYLDADHTMFFGDDFNNLDKKNRSWLIRRAEWIYYDIMDTIGY
jgi:hypothetical protein